VTSQVQLRATEKRVGVLAAMLALFAIIVAGVSAGLLLGRLYFLRELLFFATLIAIMVFLGTNLAVAAILIGRALRGIVAQLGIQGRGSLRAEADFEHTSDSDLHWLQRSRQSTKTEFDKVLSKPELDTGCEPEIILTVTAASEVVAKPRVEGQQTF
jgi:hypothetical protein